ncbi:FHA domain-containing protein [Georgenia sp. MJ173]|uniref:FHA domain-containing protein n=1 Tax=Georgenia sunbinii TaxID=3117728 RepID=UPI002F26084D
MTGHHEYLPGGWTAIVTGGGVALLDPAVAPEVARELWQLASAGRRLGAWVEYLAGTGIATLPSFAMVETHDGGLRVLVRGEIEVAAGGHVVSGRGYTTWREELLTATTEVTLTARPGTGPWLPLTGGIVGADAIRVAATEPDGGSSAATAAAADEEEDLELTVARLPALAALAGRPPAGAPHPSGAPVAPAAPVEPPAQPAPVAAPPVALAPEDPAVVEDPAVAEDPAVGEGSGVVEDPAVGEGSGVVEDPAVGEGSGVVEDPAVGGGSGVVEDTAVGEGAGVVEDPAVGAGSGVVEAPAVGEGSGVAEDPAVGEGSGVVEDPAVGEGSGVVEDPAVGEGSAVAGDGADAGEGAFDETAADTDQLDDGAPWLTQPAPDLEATRAPDPEPADPEPADPWLAPDWESDATVAAASLGAPTPASPALPVPAPAVPGPATPDHPALIDSVPGRPRPPAPDLSVPVGRPVDLPAPEGTGPAEPPDLDLVDGEDEGDHDGETILASDLPVSDVPIAEDPVVTAAPDLELVLSTGQRVELSRPVLLGRAPEASRFVGGEAPRLVSVPNPEKDVSATHVEVRPAGSHVVVTDMNSTNGTVVALLDQPAFRLQPGTGVPVPAGAVIEIGAGVSVRVAPAGEDS